ncbi:MAG TPA: GNAT family N-acetyltransferase [Candidatus Lachnoclostridium stercorigallinarum]|uniref:GNAT family N-acetyltransferase n=1 Tax=Candidatus Lachnoclostridium stercorigallinarum TaxID=2838634 RepID=A0A9D2GJQ2_9FIRM|nr:GNAT family N-acetyltransferase [Candidatus Lachnoclostridium stercorigallinarum]
MEIRRIENKLEIQKALELIWETFLQFEAPDYSEEGIKSFKDFIDDEAMVNTLEFFGAYENGIRYTPMKYER